MAGTVSLETNRLAKDIRACQSDFARISIPDLKQRVDQCRTAIDQLKQKGEGISAELELLQDDCEALAIRLRLAIGKKEGEDKKSRQIMIEDAERYYKSLSGFPSPVSFAMKVDPQPSDEQILEEIFERHHFEGFCLGEYHTESTPKKFLLENMQALKKMGVETLFMEHFFYDTQQSHLDDYFRSPTEKMHPELEKHISRIDFGSSNFAPYRIRDVLREAKAAGIRVVGIDHSLAHGLFDDTTGKGLKNRLEVMNHQAIQIVAREKVPGKKYLAFVGTGHACTLEFSKGRHMEECTVPGIAELLQCPIVTVESKGTYLGIEETHINVSKILVEKCEHVPAYVKKHVHLLLKRPFAQPLAAHVRIPAVNRELHQIEKELHDCQRQLKTMSLEDIRKKIDHLRNRLKDIQFRLEMSGDTDLLAKLELLLVDLEGLEIRLRLAIAKEPLLPRALKKP